MYPYRMSVLCAALIAGIFAGPCFAGAPWAFAALLGASICCAAGSLRGKQARAWLTLVPLLLLIGTALAPAPRASALEGYSLASVTLQGTVVARPCGAPGENRVLCKLARDVPAGPEAGKTIYLDLELSKDPPEWGERISASGDLFVFSEGGPVVGTLSRVQFQNTEPPANPLRRASNLLRRSITTLCEKALSRNTGGLLAGIILGDYRCLSPEDAASLKRSGLIHLCSASGLHVGILLLICAWLARRLRLGRSAALVSQMPLLLIYAMAAGMTPPIVRSGCLALVAAVAFWRAREFHLISAMSGLALFSLLLTPELLSSISWQLTYLAAAGCVLLASPLARAMKAGKNKAVLLLATSLAAQAAIAPLLLYHFGEFSLLAPLSNLAVIPVIPAVMVLGIIGACVSWLPPWLLHHVMWPLEILLRSILAVSRLAASQTWAVIFNPGITPISLALWYPLLWLALLRRAHVSARDLRRGLCCLILVAMAVLWPGTALRATPSGARIVFLDVGQGDSVLLQGGGGETILVDGGPDQDALTAKLRSYGVRSLDLLILTHPHSDHIGGLTELARLWPIGTFAHNGDPAAGGLTPLLNALAAQRTPVEVLSAGNLLRLGSIVLSVLAPGSFMADEDNENSLVLRAEIGEISLLLAGDIGERREQELMDDGATLRSDLLKVPHHGGSSPVGEEFFAAVKPTCAIIQVGRGNTFGHPALSTLQFLRRGCCRVFRTDDDGDIVVSNPDGRMRVSTQRRP